MAIPIAYRYVARRVDDYDSEREIAGGIVGILAGNGPRDQGIEDDRTLKPMEEPQSTGYGIRVGWWSCEEPDRPGEREFQNRNGGGGRVVKEMEWACHAESPCRAKAKTEM